MDALATIKKKLYVIDLPENDKAIVVNLTVSMLYFSFFCVSYVSERLTGATQIMNLDVVHQVQKLSLISLTGMALLLAFILYIRKTNPNSTLPSNIQIYLVFQPLVLFAVLNGVTQLVTGLLLGMLPFIGLILFNRKHVFYATGLIWMEIIILAFAVSAGWLPNAPLYTDQVRAQQVPFVFTLAQLSMSGPAAIVVYVLGHSLMQGIVLKEKKILELSRTDGLTGLWNRRYLNELLQHEIALTHRNLYCLSIFIVDLDYFKRINDTYGHSAGDKVLMETTKILQECARVTDYLGRFGGEEFLVVLPNCDAKMALQVANRYRLTLAQHAIQLGDEQVFVTGSFGLTTIQPTNSRDYDIQVIIDQLINTADKALYDAKTQGRNCVKFSPMDEGQSVVDLE